MLTERWRADWSGWEKLVSQSCTFISIRYNTDPEKINGKNLPISKTRLQECSYSTYKEDSTDEFSSNYRIIHTHCWGQYEWQRHCCTKHCQIMLWTISKGILLMKPLERTPQPDEQTWKKCSMLFSAVSDQTDCIWNPGKVRSRVLELTSQTL